MASCATVALIAGIITAANIAHASGCPSCGTKTTSEAPSWAGTTCNGCTSITYPYCNGENTTTECLDNGGAGTGSCCSKTFTSEKCKAGTQSC